MILHRQEFALPEGHPLSSGYDLRQCFACGFIYADTAGDFADYYSRMSKYQTPNKFDVERIEETAKAIGQFLRQAASVIDVGCADGGLLALLKSANTKVLGVDPSPECVALAAARGIPAIVGSIESMPPGRFDLIILSHVLEHIHDLRGAVSSIRRSLSPDGVVYIEVPNAEAYEPDMPFQDINTEHINHFTKETLLHLFRGFDLCGDGVRRYRVSDQHWRDSIFAFFSLGKMDVYLIRSDEHLSAMNAALANDLSGVPSVYVWGYGQLAMKLLKGCLQSKRIVGVVDSSPVYHGQRVLGAPIIPAAEIDSDEPIVIASMISQKSIETDIRNLGLTNRIVTVRV